MLKQGELDHTLALVIIHIAAPTILLRVAAFKVIGFYRVRIEGTNANYARAITSDK